MVYLIGSLRNPQVPIIANQLRVAGFDVFDDWYAAGPEADDKWRDYEKARGRTFTQALNGYAARHVFQFDYTHLQRATAAVLLAPAGKSGHLELGWMLGQNKPGFYLVDNNVERWDVMLQFPTLKVVTSVQSLIGAINEQHVLARPKRNMLWCDTCHGYVEEDSTCTFRSLGVDNSGGIRHMAGAGRSNLRAGERE
jgi:hypothetical protein